MNRRGFLKMASMAGAAGLVAAQDQFFWLANKPTSIVKPSIPEVWSSRIMDDCLDRAGKALAMSVDGQILGRGDLLPARNGVVSEVSMYAERTGVVDHLVMPSGLKIPLSLTPTDHANLGDLIDIEIRP